MADELAPKKYDHLYSLSNRGEFDQLIQYIQNHTAENVRYGAAGVLSESITDFKPVMTREHRQALVASVLNDPSDDVRATIVDILLEIDDSTLETIITRLQAEPESTPTGTPYPLILTKWHGKPTPELRYLAVVGFERVGSGSAIQKLRTTIERESDMRVLRRAILAGGNVGDETFVSPIQERLRIEKEQYDTSLNSEQIRRVKEAAVEALVKLGTDAAYEALLTASRGTDDQLKEHALSEIGKFGAEETVDVIVDELDNDENDALRQEAASGVMTAFREAEFEEGDSIRQQAIKQISDEVSTDVSSEFATIVSDSPRKSEQRNAAWLLGQLEAETDVAVESLIEAISDDDEYLAKIATASLTNVDATALMEKIDSLLETVDEDSEAYELATFLKSHLHDDAEEAKKELVEYSYVTTPSDYTAKQD